MATGTVKFFNAQKGYGFIAALTKWAPPFRQTQIFAAPR